MTAWREHLAIVVEASQIYRELEELQQLQERQGTGHPERHRGRLTMKVIVHDLSNSFRSLAPQSPMERHAHDGGWRDGLNSRRTPRPREAASYCLLMRAAKEGKSAFTEKEIRTRTEQVTWSREHIDTLLFHVSLLYCATRSGSGTGSSQA